MPTMANRTRTSTRQLLRNVARLSGDEFNDFMAQAAALRAPQRALCLSREEAKLLLKINKGPPPEWRPLHRKLVAKRRAGTLSASEHRQLLRVAEKMERYDAKRLGWLTQLAALRKVPLRALIRSLGLKMPAYV